MIPGMFMIFIGMVFSIKDEVDTLTLNIVIIHYSRRL